MKKAIYLVILFSSILCKTLFCVEINLISQIPLSQDKVTLMQACFFVVTEDDIFIVTDARAADYKLYNSSGQLIEIWGRKGPGPNEFRGPFYCDYQKPYFVNMDFGKLKVCLYKRIGKSKLEKIDEFLCLRAGYDIELMGDNILVAGHIADSNGKRYELYMRNFKNKKTHFLLQAETKYGFKSFREYKKNIQKVALLGSFGYFNVKHDYVYYVWECNLRIIKLNLITKEMSIFGEETKNYTKPKLTKAFERAYREKTDTSNERKKMSYIIGIFATDDFIGLLYKNFDEKNSFWKIFLQLYNPEGKLIEEKILPGAVYYPMTQPPFFFNKKNSHLYFLSKTLNKDFTDDCTIMEYEIVN